MEGRMMRDPLFCKKAVPAPSAKNSYMAGGKDRAFLGAGFHAVSTEPGTQNRPAPHWDKTFGSFWGGAWGGRCWKNAFPRKSC
ncbi:MAG: hypothetical protein ACLQPD_25930, partial [Desulfomonilaceae bacterium]